VRQIATAENEIAKTMLDTEQARSQINSLEKKKSELEAEMNSKDDIVAKSQAEIKRRNVEIKRKQDQLQQLSSELDKLITLAGGAELGPLEVEINSLQKSIDNENANIAELQHAWLRDQGELVSRAVWARFFTQPPMRRMRICFTGVFLFFFAFSVCHKNTRQLFSGTVERIFMKVLPNDSGENEVCIAVPKCGLGPQLFLGG